MTISAPSYAPRTPGGLLAGGLLFALSCMSSGIAVAATPVDRSLEIKLSVQGHQDWRNELQWSKATTQQRYEFSTTLRSNGQMHGANILHQDRDQRLAIKTEFLRQQGLQRLKASGLDPDSPQLQQEISRTMQQEMFDCKGESVCMAETHGKYATILAAALEPDNSALFEGEPRYQFFFGYAGCPTGIRAMHNTQVEGETAYGRKKDNIQPYTLSMVGESTGSEEDRSSLCRNYTAVFDSKDSKLYVENVDVPNAEGAVTRTEFGKTSTRDEELPVPGVVLEWVNATLREAPPSGEAKTKLPMNLPLDGNSTVLGQFTGEVDAQLQWAWK